MSQDMDYYHQIFDKIGPLVEAERERLKTTDIVFLVNEGEIQGCLQRHKFVGILKEKKNFKETERALATCGSADKVPVVFAGSDQGLVTVVFVYFNIYPYLPCIKAEAELAKDVKHPTAVLSRPMNGALSVSIAEREEVLAALEKEGKVTTMGKINAMNDAEMPVLFIGTPNGRTAVYAI